MTNKNEKSICNLNEPERSIEFSFCNDKNKDKLQQEAQFQSNQYQEVIINQNKQSKSEIQDACIISKQLDEYPNLYQSESSEQNDGKEIFTDETPNAQIRQDTN